MYPLPNIKNNTNCTIYAYSEPVTDQLKTCNQWCSCPQYVMLKHSVSFVESSFHQAAKRKIYLSLPLSLSPTPIFIVTITLTALIPLPWLTTTILSLTSITLSLSLSHLHYSLSLSYHLMQAVFLINHLATCNYWYLYPSAISLSSITLSLAGSWLGYSPWIYLLFYHVPEQNQWSKVDNWTS